MPQPPEPRLSQIGILTPNKAEGKRGFNKKNITDFGGSG